MELTAKYLLLFLILSRAWSDAVDAPMPTVHPESIEAGKRFGCWIHLPISRWQSRPYKAYGNTYLLAATKLRGDDYARRMSPMARRAGIAGGLTKSPQAAILAHCSIAVAAYPGSIPVPSTSGKL